VAATVHADLARPGEADRLVEEAESALGPLDTLVVNHGIWKKASLVDMTPEEWAETLAINLDGSYAVCRAAARRMAPRGRGVIVTVASTAGQRGEAHHSHYAASKGALLAFTKSLAAELGPSGIRVNGVAPGWVLTDMSREALSGESGRQALAKIPLGRPGTPEEVAGPVAFLASDLASYLVGEILCVNGGAVMMG
jgi:3-oxoacyl-[acyl-carrier protein] reductase